MSDPAVPPAGTALRVLADDMWPSRTVSVATAFGGGLRLIADRKAATLTATAVWFLGALALTASNVAMPVAAQYVCLILGLLLYVIGVGIIARFTLTAAADTRPTARDALRVDAAATRFSVATTLITAVELIVVYLAAATAIPAVVAAAAAVAVVIAVTTAATPYHCALGDPLGTAITRSAHAARTPRVIITALLALAMIGISATIPIAGLLLMPWQTATWTYLRFHDVDVKHATTPGT